MKTKLSKLFLICSILCSSFIGLAQNSKEINYSLTEVSRDALAGLGDIQITAKNSRIYKMDIDAIKTQMDGVMYREEPGIGFTANIMLPHPDGSIHEYQAKGNHTMHPDLGAFYPEINSYDAAGLDNVAKVKWDITPAGLHAMIMLHDQSTIFIDPIIKGNTEYYIVYHKFDFYTDKVMECDVTGNSSAAKTTPTGGPENSFGTCELRTYRLALAATAEYTTFHGSAILAAAAQVTTMNRVNGVYERDMAITMNIVANNNLLIFTNAGSDPYTNGNAGSMINQNQTEVNTTIGNANYDIGHVFGTNSGGLAGLGVVCVTNQKARGVTGSNAPIGDPFDIDYVSHEMGHQFDANHTQNNNCNRNNATAMEPGSASTIMGYAGICAPNVQNNSDDHFHGVSLEEIGGHITSTGCPVTSALANAAPSITGTNGNVSIPAGTPFALTAIATDPDGDVLSYCWEQMDNGVSTQSPVGTSTIGPNFRSNSPVTNDTRYFPNLADLAAGGPFTWEVLPTVSRTMNFRVTVRDQSLGVAGCNDHTDVTVSTDAGSGPFIVQYPSATGIVWAGASSETVLWDVANTDAAPVSCATVDILLSTDGGLTYPTVLATGVANDGSQAITVPNVGTTTARVMVINSGGTFFDISDNNFTITLATNDYTIDVATSTVSICQPTDATYTVDIGSIGGYNDPVTLSVTGVPAGATSAFSTNPVTPVGTSVLTISNTGSATPGSYTLTIQGNSTTGTKTTDVTLNISSGTPTAVTLTSPADVATGVGVPTTFTWSTAPEVGVTYEIDIAVDAGFAGIVDQATGLATTTYNSAILASGTTYYWRVRSATGCATASWSSTWSFTTGACSIIASTDVGQTTDVASFTSIINVAATGTINDINIPVFQISHPWVGDLRAELMSPAGTVVELFNQPGLPASTWGCDGDDIDASFDDGAALTSADFEAACAGAVPTIAGAYQSIDPLSGFNGESVTGNWTLTIYDDYTGGDDGTLDAWSLEFCTTAIPCILPSLATVSGTAAICDGESVTLSIASGNLNDATDWEWYSGSCGGTSEGSGTSIIVSPTTATSYFVRGEGGCVGGGVCAQFDVTINPDYNTNESATICTGQTYTFPDGSTGTTTQMYTSNMTTAAGCDSIIVTDLTVVSSFNTNENASICDGDTYTFPDGTTGTTAQSYTSTLASTGGCDSIIVTNLTVTTVDVSVTQTGPTLTANASGATFVWVDCDNGNSPISGATGASYTATELVGNYTVEVTQNGCTEMSTCYPINQTGIDDLTGSQVLVYPNPATDKVVVTWVGDVKSIEITDTKGKLLKRIQVEGEEQMEISLSEYSKGVYFIHVLNQEGRTVFDLIKQ